MKHTNEFVLTQADKNIKMPDNTTPNTHERNLSQAMLKGFRMSCPRCGCAPLFKGYLKVRHSCPSCEQELYHHRADDGPAYLTILIVAHLIAPVILFLFVTYRPDPLVLASVISVGTIALSLWLLPRLKGIIIAIQWAKEMHGFDRNFRGTHSHSEE